MIHDYEFDLLWAEDPPEWVRFIGPLMEYWGNPVFQRRYMMWRLHPAMGSLKAFLAGVGCSVFINLLLFFLDRDNAVEWGFYFTILGPGGLTLSITGVRLFSSCMISTPNELRAELASDSLGSLLTAPISDRKIFIAECLSGVMRSLGAIEENASLVAGLVLPYLAILSPILYPRAKELGIELVWWVVLGIMVIIWLVLILLYGAFSSGLFAVYMPIAMSIPISLIWVVALWALPSLLSVYGIIYLWRNFEIVGSGPLILGLLFMSMQIVLISVLTTYTSQLGVKAFAKARRPGFYEWDGMSASGLMVMEERESSYRWTRL